MTLKMQLIRSIAFLYVGNRRNLTENLLHDIKGDALLF